MPNVRTTQRDFAAFIAPKPDWRILLLAGDNADAIPARQFAAHVSHLTVVCRSAEQARKCTEPAANALGSHIVYTTHDPNQLPYEDGSFDLVICFHIVHELLDTTAWLLEASRIIRPQGSLVIRTLSVPGTRLRGKKARKLRESAEYINAIFQLHSPSDGRYDSQNQWEDLLMGTGFDIQNIETSVQLFDFTTWVDKASLTHRDRLRLQAMLIQAPEKANEFLTPQFSGDKIEFRLPEITILAVSKANKT